VAGARETPYPKKVRHLPGVLSQEEVARLIEAADTPFHRILLMTDVCHRRTPCKALPT